jgi:hypothetical protein
VAKYLPVSAVHLHQPATSCPEIIISLHGYHGSLGKCMQTRNMVDQTHIVAMPIINFPLYGSMNSLQEQLYHFLQGKKSKNGV